jgi:hypothetical protein
MGRGAVADLLRGQVLLFGGLLLCVALRPQSLGANQGISYFGVHWRTVVPYAVGLVCSALFTRRGLRRIPDGPGYLRAAADAIALLTVGIVLTPFSLNGVVDWTHTLLGAALFLLQLVLAAWLVHWSRGGLVSVLLWLVQLAGGLVAAVYVLPSHGLLIQGQLLFQLGFGALALRTAALGTTMPQRLGRGSDGSGQSCPVSA